MGKGKTTVLTHKRSSGYDPRICWAASGIPGTSMSKPLSRRSRDFFAGIPRVYSASPGSGCPQSTYEPAPFTLTRSPCLSPQERSPAHARAWNLWTCLLR
jgi:hypothetical protein